MPYRICASIVSSLIMLLLIVPAAAQSIPECS
jgi:hypothetical protein